MGLRRKNRFAAEVSTASLNDIMFFLLLFFLIVSTVANPSVIKLMLPKASKSQSLNKQSVSLSITKDKKYYINNTPVVFSGLEAALQKATEGIPEPTIVLRTDKSLQIQDLVDVLNIGNKLKIKMVLSTTNK
ncbi:MAG: ExbD/TolR family protein [Thermoflexibacteraceae bacterium]|jgi:biopolymer transport protein ExbD